MNPALATKLSVLLTFASLAPAWAHHGQQDQEIAVLLKDVKVASENGHRNDLNDFAIGGVAFKWGLMAQGRSYKVTVLVPENMKSFVCDVGFNDERTDDHDVSLHVLLDGNPAEGDGSWGTIKSGKKPFHYELNVAGKKSLQLIFDGVCLGEPHFSTHEVSSVGPKPAKQAQGPELVSPSDKAHVSGDSVVLRWKPVDGAICYGITVVSLKADSDMAPTAPRVWSSTVTEAKLSFKLAGLANGDYLWSVIAFGPKQPIGTYSSESLMTVEQ